MSKKGPGVKIKRREISSRLCYVCFPHPVSVVRTQRRAHSVCSAEGLKSPRVCNPHPCSHVTLRPSLFVLPLAVCDADYPCEGMSRHATFENFGMAFLTLFQVSTGDNWNGIMKVRPSPCGLPLSRPLASAEDTSLPSCPAAEMQTFWVPNPFDSD